MLTEPTKNEIRERLKKVAATLPGYRDRAGQKAMIAEVARTFARCPDAPLADGVPCDRPVPGTTIACIQGGTGIGKSLGYSLPGAILARSKGKRLVIATATVALQEQLTQRDLPAFLEAAELNLTLELAKGRARYVCIHRLRQAVKDMAQADMQRGEHPGGIEASRDVRIVVEGLLRDYDDRVWNGDRDLRNGIEDSVWSAITTDRHGCMGSNCPQHNNCAQVEARKRLKAADVIVANHDLVLADLAMGGGKVLPAPNECFYIIDEAHGFPEKAVAAFASEHRVDSGRRLSEKVASFAGNLSKALGKSFDERAKEITIAAGRLDEALKDVYEFFGCLSQLRPTEKHPRPVLDFMDSCIPEEFYDIGNNVVAQADRILGHINDALEMLPSVSSLDSKRKELCDRLVADAGYYASRVEEIGSTWKLFLAEPDPGQPPIAKWVETVASPKGIDYQLHASPVRASSFLNSALWNEAAGAVLTSATLKTLGTFDDFLVRSGLIAYKDVVCADMPSSFDYSAQGVIEIPKMSALPANYELHTEGVKEWIVDLCQNLDGGMLVLFTSRRQMNDVASALPASVRDIVLVQGADSKAALLARHKKRIDDGEDSVIFGLESFSEGVDLPGRYCTCVVVPKLPFDVPDDPVLKALSAWIEQRGGNPFQEISVPAAARKLEQRAGRLIRTETDFGRVIVLDMRLWDTRYGKQMLRGLPPFRLLVKGSEVRL